MTKAILSGRKVAVLMESEFIPEEIKAYSERFTELGAELHFVSRLWGNSELTFLSDAVNDPSHIAQQFTVTRDLTSLNPDAYDAVIMAANYTSVRLRQFDTPLGVSPSPALVGTAPAVEFFARAMSNKFLVKAALCHGLWILTPRPDLLRGRHVICHEVVLADIINAGAQFVADPTGVVVDDDLVTGRSKDEVFLFIDTIAQQILNRAKVRASHETHSAQATNEAGGAKNAQIEGAYARGTARETVENTVNEIVRSLHERFALAVKNHTGGPRPVAAAAKALVDGTLDVASEVRRLIGVGFDATSVANRKPILLIASKFGVWASELTLVAGTLLRAGYSVKIATEDGSPPHMLSPSIDPAFTDGAWRESVVSVEEQALALKFLKPNTQEHSLIEVGNILNLGCLARPPQVGDYLQNPSVLDAYKEALSESLGIAEKFEAIVVAGGSGAVPGLMADRGLQSLILAFFDLGKPVMGECNGGLAIAQTVDPRTNRSILSGRAVTTHCWLDEYQQGWGWTGSFDHDTDQYWHNNQFSLESYSKAESWIQPGVGGNPLIASESLFANAAGTRGLFFSPPGTPYAVVVDGNLITCRTTPDGYPGTLAMIAIMNGDPPLRGRLFVDHDERGRTAPVGNGP